MIPHCQCHDEPMAPKRHSRGGWTCRVKKRERDRAALLTPAGRRRQRKFHLRWEVKRRTAGIQRREEILRSHA